MKQIDNQGFLMVETIIVAVFVIGICTFLFTNFLPLIADYERVSDYDNVDTKYKAHEIRKMLDYLGHPVLYLKRISMGPVDLQGLKKGQFKYIKPKQLQEIKNYLKKLNNSNSK